MMKDLSFDDSVSVYIDYKNAKANSEWKKQDKYKNRTVSQADMVYTIFYLLDWLFIIIRIIIL